MRGPKEGPSNLLGGPRAERDHQGGLKVTLPFLKEAARLGRGHNYRKLSPHSPRSRWGTTWEEGAWTEECRDRRPQCLP